MRRIIHVLLAQCLSLAGLAAPPNWIRVLPAQPGKVYAVGAAPLTGNQAQSLRQAEQAARVEVVTQLRATVHGETSIQSTYSQQKQTTGGGSAQARLNVAQDSRITSQAQDLPGLTITETWVDADSRTVYALACMDLAKAVMDLQARLEHVRNDTGDPVDPAASPAERARAILRLKRGRDELVRLDALLEPLMSSPAAPLIRSDLRGIQKELERKGGELRASMMLGLRDEQRRIPDDLAAVLRNAALQQGLGWGDAKADFLVEIRFPAGDPTGRTWWKSTGGPDFLEARSSLQVVITDRHGRIYESTPLEPYGVGTTEVTANQGILKDCQKKIATCFDQWLGDLAL